MFCTSASQVTVLNLKYVAVKVIRQKGTKTPLELVLKVFALTQQYVKDTTYIM